MTNIYQPNGANKDTMVLSVPLSFTRSGHYFYSDGGLGSQASFGNYWASAHYLAFGSGFLYPQYSNYRGYAFSLRCLAR